MGALEKISSIDALIKEGNKKLSAAKKAYSTLQKRILLAREELDILNAESNKASELALQRAGWEYFGNYGFGLREMSCVCKFCGNTRYDNGGEVGDPSLSVVTATLPNKDNVYVTCPICNGRGRHYYLSPRRAAIDGIVFTKTTNKFQRYSGADTKSILWKTIDGECQSHGDEQIFLKLEDAIDYCIRENENDDINFRSKNLIKYSDYAIRFKEETDKLRKEEKNRKYKTST